MNDLREKRRWRVTGPYEEIVTENPFSRIKTSFKEPMILPKTISLGVIQQILSCAYNELESCCITKFHKNEITRDIAVLELLFATGARVSEICMLKKNNIDLINRTVRILGKGSRERIIQIENPDVLQTLTSYYLVFKDDIEEKEWFFVNRLHNRLSEQSVRLMIKKHVEQIGHNENISPHMFRHAYLNNLKTRQ